jgi:hypothetical protein
LDFFFDVRSASTGPANPPRRTARLAQLTPTTGNRVAVQSSDAGQQGDAAAAVLAGEKASDEPAGAFIGGSDEAVEGTMLSGHSAVGVFSAARALTRVDEPPTLVVSQRFPGQTFLLGHWTLPPFGQPTKGARLLYSPIAEVVVEH